MKPATIKAALLCASVVQVAALAETAHNQKDSQVQSIARRDESAIAASSLTTGSQDTTIITVGEVSTTTDEKKNEDSDGGSANTGNVTSENEENSGSTASSSVESGSEKEAPVPTIRTAPPAPQRIVKPVIQAKPQAPVRPVAQPNIFTRATKPKGITSYTKVVSVSASSKDSRATGLPAVVRPPTSSKPAGGASAARISGHSIAKQTPIPKTVTAVKYRGKVSHPAKAASRTRHIAPPPSASVTPARRDAGSFLSRIFGTSGKKLNKAGDTTEQKTGGKNGVAISDGATSKSDGAAAPGGSAQKLIGEMFGTDDGIGLKKKPKKALFNAKEEISKDGALSSSTPVTAAQRSTIAAAVTVPSAGAIQITVKEESKKPEFEASIVLKEGDEAEKIVIKATREPLAVDEKMDSALSGAEAWLSHKPISDPAPASLKLNVNPIASSSTRAAPSAPRAMSKSEQNHYSGVASKTQAAHVISTVTVYAPPPIETTTIHREHQQETSSPFPQKVSSSASHPGSSPIPHTVSSTVRVSKSAHQSPNPPVPGAPIRPPAPLRGPKPATQKSISAANQAIADEVSADQKTKKVGPAAQPFATSKSLNDPLADYTKDKPIGKENQAVKLLEKIDVSTPVESKPLSGANAVIANEEERERKETLRADGVGTTGDNGQAISYNKKERITEVLTREAVIDLFGDAPVGGDALDRIDAGKVNLDGTGGVDTPVGNLPRPKPRERVGGFESRPHHNFGEIPPDMVILNPGRPVRKADRPLDPEFLESANPALVNKFTDVTMSTGKTGAVGNTDEIAEGERMYMDGGPNNLLDFEGFKRPDGGFEGYILQRQPGFLPAPPRLSDYEGGPEYYDYLDDLDYPEGFYPEQPAVPIAHIVVNNYNDIKNTNENQNDNSIANTNDNRIANDLAADASAKNEATTYNDNSVSSDNRAFSFNDNSAVNNLNDYMFQDNKYYSFQDLSSNDIIQHIYPQPIFINKKEFKTILPGDNEYVTVNADCACYTKKSCDTCTPVTAYLPKASMPPIPQDMVRVGYSYEGLVRDPELSDPYYQGVLGQAWGSDDDRSLPRQKKVEVKEVLKGKTIVNDAQAHVVHVHDEWVGDGVGEQRLIAKKVSDAKIEEEIDSDSEYETDTDDEEEEGDKVVDYAIKEEFKEEVVASCEEEVTPEVVVEEVACERKTRTKVHRVTMPIVVRTRVARVPRMRCRTPPAETTKVCEQTLDTFTHTHTITPVPEASPEFVPFESANVIIPVAVQPTAIPGNFPAYTKAIPTSVLNVWVPAQTLQVVGKPVSPNPNQSFQDAQTVAVVSKAQSNMNINTASVVIQPAIVIEPTTYVHTTIHTTLPPLTITSIRRVTVKPPAERYIYHPPPVTVTQFQDPITETVTPCGICEIVTTVITPEPVTIVETQERITIPYHTTITAPAPIVEEVITYPGETVTEFPPPRVTTITPCAVCEHTTSYIDQAPVTITRKPRPVTIARKITDEWLPDWYQPIPTVNAETEAEHALQKRDWWWSNNKKDERPPLQPGHKHHHKSSDKLRYTVQPVPAENTRIIAVPTARPKVHWDEKPVTTHIYVAPTLHAAPKNGIPAIPLDGEEVSPAHRKLSQAKKYQELLPYLQALYPEETKEHHGYIVHSFSPFLQSVDGYLDFLSSRYKQALATAVIHAPAHTTPVYTAAPVFTRLAVPEIPLYESEPTATQPSKKNNGWFNWFGGWKSEDKPKQPEVTTRPHHHSQHTKVAPEPELFAQAVESVPTAVTTKVDAPASSPTQAKKKGWFNWFGRRNKDQNTHHAPHIPETTQPPVKVIVPIVSTTTATIDEIVPHAPIKAAAGGWFHRNPPHHSVTVDVPRVTVSTSSVVLPEPTTVMSDEGTTRPLYWTTTFGGWVGQHIFRNEPHLVYDEFPIRRPGYTDWRGRYHPGVTHQPQTTLPWSYSRLSMHASRSSALAAARSSYRASRSAEDARRTAVPTNVITIPTSASSADEQQPVPTHPHGSWFHWGGHGAPRLEAQVVHTTSQVAEVIVPIIPTSMAARDVLVQPTKKHGWFGWVNDKGSYTSITTIAHFADPATQTVEVVHPPSHILESTTKHHWFGWGRHEKAVPAAVSTGQTVVYQVNPHISRTTVETVQPTTVSEEWHHLPQPTKSHGWFHWEHEKVVQTSTRNVEDMTQALASSVAHQGAQKSWLKFAEGDEIEPHVEIVLAGDEFGLLTIPHMEPEPVALAVTVSSTSTTTRQHDSDAPQPTRTGGPRAALAAELIPIPKELSLIPVVPSFRHSVAHVTAMPVPTSARKYDPNEIEFMNYRIVKHEHDIPGWLPPPAPTGPASNGLLDQFKHFIHWGPHKKIPTPEEEEIARQKRILLAHGGEKVDYITPGNYEQRVDEMRNLIIEALGSGLLDYYPDSNAPHTTFKVAPVPTHPPVAVPLKDEPVFDAHHIHHGDVYERPAIVLEADPQRRGVVKRNNPTYGQPVERTCGSTCWTHTEPRDPLFVNYPGDPPEDDHHNWFWYYDEEEDKYFALQRREGGSYPEANNENIPPVREQADTFSVSVSS